MTPAREAINQQVAAHLQEALTWCVPRAAKNRMFDSIRKAPDHDQMVERVKETIQKLFK